MWTVARALVTGVTEVFTVWIRFVRLAVTIVINTVLTEGEVFFIFTNVERTTLSPQQLVETLRLAELHPRSACRLDMRGQEARLLFAFVFAGCALLGFTDTVTVTKAREFLVVTFAIACTRATIRIDGLLADVADAGGRGCAASPYGE